MTVADENRISQLLEELDRLVPRDGACVRLEQYGGGPDEGRMVANQTGYLRFGIELLKAGAAPHKPSMLTQPRVVVDLTYLVSPDSVIGFDEFIRDDAIAVSNQCQSAPSKMLGTALSMSFGLGCVAVLIFAVLGLIAMLRWL